MTDQHDKDGGDQETSGGESVALSEHEAHEDRDIERRDGEERQREQRWQKRFAIYSLIFDGIVAVSAVAGGFFIWQQLVLLRESNGLTRETLAESRRALVVSQRAQLVVEISSFMFDAAGQPTDGSVTVRNAGHLPATNVRWQVCLASALGGSPELKKAMAVLPDDSYTGVRDVIGPGAIRVLQRARRSSPFCPPMPAQPGARTYLIARLQYMDGFGQERYLDHCRIWSSVALNLGPDSPAANAPCVGFGGEGFASELKQEKR